MGYIKKIRPKECCSCGYKASGDAFKRSFGNFLFGKDKHPSGNWNCSSEVPIIFGLIKTRGFLTLTTQTLLLIPIWFAAKPIPFLDVVDPFSLGIFDENRIIADKTWSDENSEISKNVKILNSFYLKANFNNEQMINLYYDKTWTILLRGKFENYDSTEDKYIMEIKLVDTNLNLDFLPDNPYWDVRLRNLLIIIPISSVVGIIIVFMLIKKSRFQKKEDILDKI